MKKSTYTTAPRDNSRGAGSSHALSNEMLTGLPSASCAASLHAFLASLEISQGLREEVQP